MEIEVLGRHCEVSDRFRTHVEEKLARLEKFGPRVIRVEVEVRKEPNPRIADQSVRVEITIVRRGPVIRAEAVAEDKLAALDKAATRLLSQVRKAADRRRVHRGSRAPQSLAQATATLPVEGIDLDVFDGPDDDEQAAPDGTRVVADGQLVVREKSHPAQPMSIEQALYEMELVGHDFFLFVDESSDQPAVVYRRKGYDYGVIRLEAG